MLAAGCREFTLENGMKITVKDDLSVSLDKAGEKRDKALMWLDRVGLDGIVKREVLVRFGKDELDKAEAAIDTLQKLKLEPEVKESIHPSTLKATIKGVMKNGIIAKGAKKPKHIDVPLELFNGHAYSIAVIGKAKA
jgi:hypothetical protein